MLRCGGLREQTNIENCKCNVTQNTSIPSRIPCLESPPLNMGKPSYVLGEENLMGKIRGRGLEGGSPKDGPCRCGHGPVNSGRGDCFATGSPELKESATLWLAEWCLKLKLRSPNSPTPHSPLNPKPRKPQTFPDKPSQHEAGEKKQRFTHCMAI